MENKRAWFVKKNGTMMASSSTMETFPKATQRKQMKSAGYTLYVDGKVYKENVKTK